MAQLDDPPWGTVLAVLRVIRRWNQVQLAQRAGGLTFSAVSRYERGSRPASRELVRRLTVAMGFPPYLLDRALSFVAAARAARAAHHDAGSGALDARVDLLVGQAGVWTEELAREVLANALVEARRLDAERVAGVPLSPSPATPSDGSPPEPGSAGPPKPRPPVGIALAILRTICGWTRVELARAAGTPAETIANYERDKTPPPLATVQNLLGAMGFPFAVFDRTVAFVEAAREARRLYLGAGDDALRATAEDIAARQARAAEDFTRRQLGALATAGRLLAARQAAPALWGLLQGCSETGRLALVRQLPEFHSAGLCELLCDESVKAAGDSAERAAQLARLAVEIAEKVAGPAGWRLRIVGYARAHLANALRVSGQDLPAAEEAFARAREMWEAGAAEDPGLLNEARMLQIEASLCRALRRLPAALTLLDRALAADRWGETPSLLLGKARTLVEAGEFDASIAVLRQVRAQLDAAREPRRLFIAVALQVLNLCHLRRFAEARLTLPQLRELAASLGNRLDLLRSDWLEGKVTAGLGPPEAAIATLERVRTGFIALSNSYDAALVTLELAEVHAALGHTGQVKALARDLAPVFQGQGVHREAQRALELFRSAAEAERASAELLRSLVTYLYRARHDPHLRFEAAA